MTFYVYDQNNSGGYYVQDDNVRSRVIIEAETERQANEKLFDILEQKAEYTFYCPCCGERWGSCFEYYENVEVTEVVAEQLKEHRHYTEAILYKEDGTKKKIPWLVYGMAEYLEE